MPLVSLKNIVKKYPKVIALNHVDFDLEKGEVHALLGENGAGKSTLMKVLYGMVTPDEGEITIDTKKVVIETPLQAIQLGIGMVHQHFMLADALTVLENIIAGAEQSHHGVVQYKKAMKEVTALIDRFAFQIDTHQKVENLSVGEKQRVEIIKVLYRGADILILDEPTAVLTPLEVDSLFSVLRLLKEEGKSIIIITHKLYEVTAIADRVTVMRDGVVTGYANPKLTTPVELATLMVGRNIQIGERHPSICVGDVRFSVEHLNLTVQGRSVLSDVSLQIRQGEILGIAGVEGNGQTELIEALTGLCTPDTMTLRLDGLTVEGTPHDFIQSGIGHVPEDRLKSAVVVDMPIYANLILGYHDEAQYKKNHLYNYPKIKSMSNEIIKEYRIKTPDSDTTIQELSGGNQQKVVIARVLEQKPKLIIFAQPTRGVDVGASEYIHQRIIEYRDAGNAVLLISADLQEVKALSDTIAVLYKGKIVACNNAESFTNETLGIYMTGGTITEKAVTTE